MAVDKLSLYNDALLLLGQRALASLTEEREPRYRLDAIYDIEAINTCLELAQPTFARKSAQLSSPSTSAVHGLDSVHTLPSDYVSVYSVFSDDKLDQPLNRYIIEDSTLACEFDTIYLRYMSSDYVTDFTPWTPTFARVVSAYLARELAERTAPAKYEDVDAVFIRRIEAVKAESAAKEPHKRPTATGFTLTTDYLNVYNDALLLLGLDELASITDDSDRRTKLDRVLLNGAVDYCLEVIKPTFAKKTSLLSSSSTSSEHDLDNVFTLPSDYVAIIEPYSDSKLDQKISRYILEGDTIACEYSEVYFRYISNGYATSLWSPSFKRVLSGYLAREASIALNPEAYQTVDDELQRRIQAAELLELSKEPASRPSAIAVTMTDSWRKIYNDALLIMGLQEITENDDDSDRRVKLDRALDADLVESVLEDTGWNFGMTSIKSQYNPSIEPEFGYQRGHNHPPDMLVLFGIYSDQYMESPHKRYKDEGEIFFTDSDELYIQYVDENFLVNPGNWPTYFRRLIAARMAKDAALSIPGANADYANTEYISRRDSAMSTDVMASPPRRLAPGNWSQSRYRGGYRNRPGG